MKAFLILDEKLSTKTLDRINKIPQDDLLICIEKSIYYCFLKNEPERKTELIDIFSTDFSEEKVQITNEIIRSLNGMQSNLLWEGLNLPYLTVNTIFDNYSTIIYNVIREISNLTVKYDITQLNLYEGSSDFQFTAITNSEGERKLRLLYKRSWYFNYFVKQAFDDKLEVVWHNKSNPLMLRRVFNLRSDIVFIGKVIFMLKRLLKRKFFNITENTIVKAINEFEDAEYAVLPVRNQIQVEPLLPVYNYLENETGITPVFLAFENYSNKRLDMVMEKNKVRHYDLYDLLSVKKILSSIRKYNEIVKDKSNNRTIKVNMCGCKLGLSAHGLIKEVAVMWFDIFLFNMCLEDAHNMYFKDIKHLINNETYGHHSAFEGEWGRKKGIPSIGVQHVAIAEVLKPRISWADNMFVLSSEVAYNLSKIKPDEKFTYVGPIAYDLYFNKSKHKDEFKSITVFTGPDDFKKEYHQIIDDLIDILMSNKLIFDINIKLHPRDNDISSFGYFERKYENIRIYSNEISSTELIIESDLVLSINSATLIQAIIIGTPSISVNYDKRYVINVDYIRDDVTEKAYNKEELEMLLLNLHSLNERYKVNRKRFIENKLDNYNGNAASRIFNKSWEI